MLALESELSFRLFLKSTDIKLTHLLCILEAIQVKTCIYICIYIYLDINNIPRSRSLTPGAGMHSSSHEHICGWKEEEMKAN